VEISGRSDRIYFHKVPNGLMILLLSWVGCTLSESCYSKADFQAALNCGILDSAIRFLVPSWPPRLNGLVQPCYSTLNISTLIILDRHNNLQTKNQWAHDILGHMARETECAA
jgi:hypothetical protein